MKKHILFLTIILLALALVGPTDALADDIFYLPPYADGETFVVAPGQQIVLDWAWLATTQGLVNTFIKGSSASYTIYNQSQVPVFELPAWMPKRSGGRSNRSLLPMSVSIAR